jgi:pilus assembly protein Flp/PilA
MIFFNQSRLENSCSEIVIECSRCGRCLVVIWSKLNANAAIVYWLIEDRRGVTAVEYALIAALIAVAAIAAFTLVGTRLSTNFSSVANKL